MNRLLTTALLFFSLCPTVHAQFDRTYIGISVLDSASRTLLPGAHVQMISGQDTIREVTNNNGQAFFNGPFHLATMFCWPWSTSRPTM